MPASLSNKELHALINIVEDRFKPGMMPKDVETLYKKMVRATKKIAVSSAKDKGRGLQYWVCEKIAAVLHVTFVQSDDLCPVHSREMGQPGCDIVLRTAEAQRKFPFSVECKSGKALNLKDSIEQAKSNQKEGTDWAVVYKKDYERPIVIVDWDAFERLLGVDDDNL